MLSIKLKFAIFLLNDMARINRNEISFVPTQQNARGLLDKGNEFLTFIAKKYAAGKCGKYPGH